MPRRSANYNQAVTAIAASEQPLVLLELHHALIERPLRYVNDVQDVLSNGEVYTAGNFAFTLPDDKERQTPRARLQISNLGGAVGTLLERTGGGRGAWLRVRTILRSAPDFVEDELILGLSNVEVTTATMTGELGYDDVLNKAGTAYTYRPEAAPGLF
ncbi:MAG: DUF1833 domain-containing protein [Desulfovibrionaceae bacterium]|jgi:hypothetical protein|nr:DUF1833 domain-containing protein [Desulfovibrionaceae bacterium]